MMSQPICILWPLSSVLNDVFSSRQIDILVILRYEGIYLLSKYFMCTVRLPCTAHRQKVGRFHNSPTQFPTIIALIRFYEFPNTCLSFGVSKLDEIDSRSKAGGIYTEYAIMKGGFVILKDHPSRHVNHQDSVLSVSII